MRYKMDFAGFDELQSDLDKLASDELTNIENDSLKTGAEIVKRNQEANWNRSSAKGEHIQDNINAGRTYESAEGRKVSVGPKISLRWRAKFVEYGTSYQAPQAPVEKSLTQAESQVYRAVMNVMERGISL